MVRKVRSWRLWAQKSQKKTRTEARRWGVCDLAFGVVRVMDFKVIWGAANRGGTPTKQKSRPFVVFAKGLVGSGGADRGVGGGLFAKLGHRKSETQIHTKGTRTAGGAHNVFKNKTQKHQRKK